MSSRFPLLFYIQEEHRNYTWTGEEKNFKFPEWAMRRLAYTPDDVSASSDYVLIIPCRKVNGTVVQHMNEIFHPGARAPLFPDLLRWLRQYHNGLPEYPTPTKDEIDVIYDVAPGPHPRLGGYHRRRIDENGEFQSEIFIALRHFGKSYIMTFTSYQILQHVCPELEPHHLYRLFYRSKRDENSYHNGPYMDWCLMADVPKDVEEGDAWDYGLRWWVKLLMRTDMTEDEIVEEAWMGRGNMWTMVIAYHKIQVEEPWYLPVPNLPPLRKFDLPPSKEETEYWLEKWKIHGVEADEIVVRVPWLSYAKACRRSCSMRNRKRIWGIVLQLKDLAVKDGILKG
ncbi:hypothetical protein AX16_004542 [Volvariella volvacea WC 439]|nr:hypothetical protein AX16_004542 [Volvariella volvacea WC 439]